MIRRKCCHREQERNEIQKTKMCSPDNVCRFKFMWLKQNLDTIEVRTTNLDLAKRLTTIAAFDAKCVRGDDGGDDILLVLHVSPAHTH